MDVERKNSEELDDCRVEEYLVMGSSLYRVICDSKQASPGPNHRPKFGRYTEIPASGNMTVYLL
jgi:hypothetical protein